MKILVATLVKILIIFNRCRKSARSQKAPFSERAEPDKAEGLPRASAQSPSKLGHPVAHGREERAGPERQRLRSRRRRKRDVGVEIGDGSGGGVTRLRVQREGVAAGRPDAGVQLRHLSAVHPESQP